MQIDLDKELQNAITGCIRTAFEGAATHYDSPFRKVANEVIAKNESEIHAVMNEAMRECLTDATRREEIKSVLKTQIAKLVIQKFGGELERRVNELKSNPETRAKMTAAVLTITEETFGGGKK